MIKLIYPDNYRLTLPWLKHIHPIYRVVHVHCTTVHSRRTVFLQHYLFLYLSFHDLYELSQLMMRITLNQKNGKGLNLFCISAPVLAGRTVGCHQYHNKVFLCKSYRGKDQMVHSFKLKIKFENILQHKIIPYYSHSALFEEVKYILYLFCNILSIAFIHIYIM